MGVLPASATGRARWKTGWGVARGAWTAMVGRGLATAVCTMAGCVKSGERTEKQANDWDQWRAVNKIRAALGFSKPAPRLRERKGDNNMAAKHILVRMSTGHAQYLGMAAAVAGGCVAVTQG